jgi:uncharacterized integral membrane protein
VRSKGAWTIVAVGVVVVVLLIVIGVIVDHDNLYEMHP